MARAGLFALVLLLGFAHFVGAEAQRATTYGAFTASESATIERNALLRDIVQTDPGLVRRALDVIADAENRPTSRQSVDRANPNRDSRDFPSDIDRSKNPDLDKALRASPEALNDLFQLIKQAGSTKPKTPPPR